MREVKKIKTYLQKQEGYQLYPGEYGLAAFYFDRTAPEQYRHDVDIERETLGKTFDNGQVHFVGFVYTPSKTFSIGRGLEPSVVSLRLDQGVERFSTDAVLILGAKEFLQKIEAGQKAVEIFNEIEALTPIRTDRMFNMRDFKPGHKTL